MSKTRCFFACACALLCLYCALVPSVYWFQHPELTNMQIMRMHWLWYASGMAFGIVGIGLHATAEGGER